MTKTAVITGPGSSRIDLDNPTEGLPTDTIFVEADSRRGVFASTDVAHLPEPARRWLFHAIAPGTILRRSATLRTHGHIKLRRWAPYQAHWQLAPPDRYLWAARVKVFGLPINGYDRFFKGQAEMRWRLFGLIPFVTKSGADVTRSAAARLASEFVFSPASALSPKIQWRQEGPDSVVAFVTVANRVHEVHLSVSHSGALRSITLNRWGNPAGGAFAEHVFGAEVLAEATFDGFTIPSEVRAGWWFGTPMWRRGEFLRFAVDDALFR